MLSLRESTRYAVWALGIFNLGVFLIVGGRTLTSKSGSSETPAYIAGDYPFELPLEIVIVAMTLLHNTTRFEIDLGSDIALKEWDTLSQHPFVVHLGGNRRAFSVAYYHQMHCVHVLVLTFLRGEYKRLNNGHVQHCLNYLRQSSLEIGDFVDKANPMLTGTAVCRDWERVNEFVDGNLKEWKQWNAS
ncbi:hypothetical protein DFH09DRAFT_375253 [Mycena vulgaris]|nr:hypothetical protein DFH09DRAFT_375253 [Mycena vulgaris]